MQVQMQHAATNRITDWTQSDAQDALVVDVIAQLEHIATPLACYTARMRHVLAAARTGTVAIEPSRTYDYVLGAFHACAREISEEAWSAIDAQLDRLRGIEA